MMRRVRHVSVGGLAAVLVALWAGAVSAQTTCGPYEGVTYTCTLVADSVTNGATGTTCTNAAPCTVATAISQLAGDGSDVLCLKDGTNYTSASDDITFESYRNTNGATDETRDVVCAINDGAVTIDGNGARAPILIRQTDYLYIAGINAHNANAGAPAVWLSDNGCSSPATTCGSQYLTFYRMGFWDSGSVAGNRATILAADRTTNVDVRDSFAFGAGRKCTSPFQSRDWIFRNWYCRYDGSAATEYHIGTSYQYYSQTVTLENFIVDNSGKTAGASCASNNGGLLANDGNPLGTIYGTDAAREVTIANGLVMQRAEIYTACDWGDNFAFFHASTSGSTQHGNRDTQINNLVAYCDSGQNCSNNKLVRSNNYDGAETPETLAATDVTAIGSTHGTPIDFTSDWDTTNMETCTSPAGCDSVYTGNTGAQLCFEWVDGVPTNRPMWPWRTNQRIIDAMTAKGYTGDDIVDVTQAVIDEFGSIPPQCRRDAKPRQVAGFLG